MPRPEKFAPRKADRCEPRVPWPQLESPRALRFPCCSIDRWQTRMSDLPPPASQTAKAAPSARSESSLEGPAHLPLGSRLQKPHCPVASEFPCRFQAAAPRRFPHRRQRCQQALAALSPARPAAAQKPRCPKRKRPLRQLSAAAALHVDRPTHRSSEFRLPPGERERFRRSGPFLPVVRLAWWLE